MTFTVDIIQIIGWPSWPENFLLRCMIKTIFFVVKISTTRCVYYNIKDMDAMVLLSLCFNVMHLVGFFREWVPECNITRSIVFKEYVWVAAEVQFKLPTHKTWLSYQTESVHDHNNILEISIHVQWHWICQLIDGYLHNCSLKQDEQVVLNFACYFLQMTAKNPSLTGEKKEILRPKTGVAFNLIAKCKYVSKQFVYLNAILCY